MMKKVDNGYIGMMKVMPKGERRALKSKIPSSDTKHISVRFWSL